MRRSSARRRASCSCWCRTISRKAPRRSSSAVARHSPTPDLARGLKIVGLDRSPSWTIDGVSTQFEIQQPVANAGGWRVLAPFKIREYRLLIAAVSLSIFAEGMWAVVMALQVIELSNDPTSLSLVATCLGAGLVAFVLVGGIAADRISQRAIIIAVETVNVIAVSTIAVLGLLG